MPGDACEEAAHRLNVVMLLVDNVIDSPRGGPASDPGGYDLLIAKEELSRIRDLLQASAAADEKRAP